MLADLPVALGSLTVLALLGAPRGGRSFCKCHHMCISYMRRGGVLHELRQQAYIDMAILTLAWLCAFAERLRGSGALAAALAGTLDPLSLLSVCAFAVSNSVLVSLAFCSLYTCTALRGMVDIFCSSVVKRPAIQQQIHQWNVLQAALRTASRTTEIGIFLLQLVAISTLLLGVAEVMQGTWPIESLAPLVPTALVVVLTIFRAAKVTDQCARVPPLVNSLCFAEGKDGEGRAMVDYIVNSGAGFYVFEVRLTSTLALKYLYLCCAGFFALCTKVL